METGHDVFLSHSSKEVEKAERICCFLESRGVKCWVAPRDVKPGVNYPAQIVKAIRNCHVFVLLVSESANTSEHVSNEVERGFEFKKLIVPFMLQDIQFSDELLYFLSRKHRIGAHSNFENGLDLLLTTILLHLEKSDCSEEKIATDVKHTQVKTYAETVEESGAISNLQKVLTAKMSNFSYLKDNYFQRECIVSHFHTIAQSQHGLHVFSIDQTINITTIFYHEIDGLISNKKTVIWFATLSESDDLQGIKDILLSNNDSGGISLFVDSIKNAKELEVLLELSRNNKKLKICTSIPKTAENSINSYIYPDTAFYEINAMEDRELEVIITKFCQEKDYAIRKVILDIFRLPHNSGFRNPVIARIIISNIKSSGATLLADDPLALFHAVEQYFENTTPSSREFFYKVTDAILESKMNNIPINKLDGFDDEIKTFCSLDILNRTKMGLGFVNLDYCYYIVACRFLETGGVDPATSLRGFLSACLPFFIKLRHIWFPESLSLDECKECMEKDKLVYLFLNDDDALRNLFILDGFQDTMLDIVKHCTETASYDISEKLLLLFDQNIAMDNPLYSRFCAEKMYLSYFKYGDLLSDDDIEDPHYLHYKGFIKYCTDKYREAKSLFERAISLTDSSETYHKQIFFDYIDALVDLGDLCTAKRLLSEIEPTTLTLKEQILMNNLKGELYKCECDFEASEHAYELALNAAYAIYDKRELAKTHGFLGELYTYWGKYDKAEENIKTNILLSQNCHDYNGIAISHQLLANLQLNKGEYKEAFENYSYSFYFANASDNNWRYYHALLCLNLFSGFERQDVAEMERKVLSIGSDQYCAYSFLTLAIIAVRVSMDQALEYLEKAQDYAIVIGNDLVCGLVRYVLQIFENSSLKDTIPYDIQVYGEGLVNAVRNLTGNSIDGLPHVECLLPFYKYQEMEGARIDLVYLAENDAHDIFDYASLDLPTKFVMWPKHRTINDTIAYIHQAREMEKKGDYYLWGIRNKNNKRIIGTIDLSYNTDENDAEFGIIISNKFWKGGYATEALHQVIGFCRNQLNINRIIGICFTANQRSSKMMRNNGFVFEKSISDYHNKLDIPDKSGSIYSLTLNDELGDE